MAKIIQPSFARGELSPALYGRVDLASYQVGLRTARNFIVRSTGGVDNRAGLRFLLPVKDHDNPPRLIAFQFNEADQYQLEFGDQYMRVIRNDGYVIESAQSFTDIASNLVTLVGHGYQTDDQVFIQDTGTTLDDRFFSVSVVDNDTFTLLDQVTGLTFTGVDATTGTVARVYEISTPYALEDLPKLKFVQSADVMTLTHPDYGERELQRFDHDDWRLVEITHLPGIDFPENLQVSGSSGSLGGNLVANSEFDLGSRSWNLGSGWSVADGIASCDGSQSAASAISQHVKFQGNGPLNFGWTYTVSFDLTVSAGTIQPYLAETPTTDAISASGSYSFVHQTQTHGDIIRFENSSDFVGTLDNVVVAQGEIDLDDFQYQVTALAEGNFEESLPAISADTKTITNITQADPAVVTAAGHGFETNDEVHIDDIVGMTELNGLRFKITVLSADTFSLNDADSTSFSAYQAGGFAAETSVSVRSDTNDLDNLITWNAVTGAQRYAVYRGKNGIFGLIGEAEGTSFQDDNIAPDLTISPPKFRDPFLSPNDFPAAVGLFQQRRVFGGSYDKPDTSFYSVTGSFKNFSASVPQQADDAIEATLSAPRVNDIRHYVSLRDLLILTGGSEWQISSGGEAAFEASTLRQNLQSEWGASHLPPIVVGNVVLFMQDNKKIVRSIGYSFQSDSYEGNNLGLLSEHLLKYSPAKEWAFSKTSSTLFIVREDGRALAFAFNPEQELVAWTPLETQGKFKSVAVIRPTSTSTHELPYFVVERTINGNTVHYIERFDDRQFEVIEDAYFMDGGKSFVGGDATLSPSTAISASELGEGVEILNSTNADCHFTAITYSPKLRQYVALGVLVLNPTTLAVAVSYDRKTWLHKHIASDGTQDPADVIWVEELDKYVGFSLNNDGANSFLTSSDGFNWSFSACQDGNWGSIAYSPDHDTLVAVNNASGPISGGAAERIQISTDGGATWEYRTAPANQGYTKVIYIPSYKRFIAVGLTVCMVSDDGGETWASRATVAQNWRGLTYAPSIGTFGRLVATGEVDKIMTSDDLGDTWTQRTAPTLTGAKTYWFVEWAEALNSFFAIGDDAVIKSSLGISWTGQEAPDPDFFGIVDAVYSAEDTAFVTLGTVGFVEPLARKYTSEDGDNWEQSWPGAF